VNYRTFSDNAPGPKYEKKGWPCQDWAAKKYIDNAHIIAVADGHGSNDCFRSETGARYAVNIVSDQLKEYFESLAPSSGNPVLFSETGIANLKYFIWTKWKQQVKNHWGRNAKSIGKENRYKTVSEKYKERYNSEDESVREQYLYYAYGTTLLVAVSIETQILLMQIGDGTCVVLQRDGEFRTPVPSDDNNFLNRTTSLCEDNAHLKIRHTVIEREFESPTYPMAVFLSTDGVDDCFPIHKNEEHLYKLYANIIESIIKKGFHVTEKEITKDTLPGLTASGSHDDISLAYFIHADIDILEETFNNIDNCYKYEVDDEMQ